ncbi:12537_t:CDS:2, partial [Rhizophagus irregularis]
KVGQLKVMTASSDYSHIIKIAIFALDEIFSEENEITCKELCELYTKFNKMYTMSRQESYTENELNIFEEAIIDWCIEFKRIFFPLSTTDCSFLKLHSWRYHAATNRKHVMQQLVNAVKHKELTPTTSGMKVIYRKTKRFGKILWELNLDSIDEKIKSLKKSENPSHPNYIEGLAQIITASSRK